MANKRSLKFLDVISFYGPFKAVICKSGRIIEVHAYRQIGNEKEIYFDNSWHDIKYFTFKPLLKNINALNECDAVALLEFLGEKRFNRTKINFAMEWINSAIYSIVNPKAPNLINNAIIIDFLKSQSYNVHGLDETEYIDINSDQAFR